MQNQNEYKGPKRFGVCILGTFHRRNFGCGSIFSGNNKHGDFEFCADFDEPQFAPVQDVFRHLKGITVQSKNIYEESFELVYEMRVNSKIEEAVLTKLNLIDGALDVNVLAPETKAA